MHIVRTGRSTLPSLTGCAVNLAAAGVQALLARSRSVACILAVAASWASWAVAAPVSLQPRTMPAIARVGKRYLSYNVEMAEVVGGKFWKPYSRLTRTAKGSRDVKQPGPSVAKGPEIEIGQNSSMFEARPPVNLYDARLRKLAAALGPAYVRVSGTWANSVFFDDSDSIAPAAPPKGFQSVLTRAEWKGVVRFAHAVDARIVTSFTISAGVRNAAGVWTAGQARRWMNYTKAIGGDIAAAEFFNEPTFAAMGGAPPGYDAADYAHDFERFRGFARTQAPHMLIVGPGSVGEGVKLMPGPLLATADLLSAYPRPTFDVFSYHSYAAASERCAALDHGIVGTTRAAALTDEWLAEPDRINDFYEGLRDRFEPGRPVWVTETADAACGGNPWAATFLDSFRFLDEIGQLAQRGVQAVFHNTLDSSDYGLIDQQTMKPRPDYWAALIWRRLMGRVVLDPGPARAGLHVYAQCLHAQPGSVAVLLINMSRTRAQTIELPVPARRYTLTAASLEATQVLLNGHPLRLMADGNVPVLVGKRVRAGSIDIAPVSITFLATNPDSRSCRGRK